MKGDMEEEGREIWKRRGGRCEQREGKGGKGR